MQESLPDASSPIAPIPSDDDRVVIHNTMWTHILPFATWLLIMMMLPAAGWSYAIRTFACLALFIWCAPWRWYPKLDLKNIPIATLYGVIVFVIWVAPETAPLARSTLWSRGYGLLGIMPPWNIPPPLTEFPYAPETAGWPLTIVRIFGSAVVIAIIEEFFWRGFLYRWMFKSNFLSVDPARFDRLAFFAVALLFGLEHNRWFVGALAGIAYGWLYIRTRDIWAVSLAHGITNLLLGIHVLVTGAYQFW